MNVREVEFWKTTGQKTDKGDSGKSQFGRFPRRVRKLVRLKRGGLLGEMR
jgi:hypothetical protein